MMLPKIRIVTGPIQSGKTTKLFKYVYEIKNIDGILAPIVNDKRRLYHISSKTIKELEIDRPSEKTISVGRYHFLRESFIWANECLSNSFYSNTNNLIIDEIGKLELMGEGLHKATCEIINNIDNSNKNLVIVVRDYLLKDVLEYYSITPKNYEILNL